MIEFSKIESTIYDIVEEYKKNQLLSDTFLKDFENKSSQRTLRIGVIGKMKAGKSSLLNALIFGNRILPIHDKPCTVTLTEIHFGESDKVEVLFLTNEEIDALRNLVQVGGDDYKTKMAAETLRNIDSIEGGYQQYTAKREMQTTIEELKDFVSEKGKYSGLAKSVKIFVNNKRLKGITIIDTPGFNDPVQSRGEDTKQAIKSCQIVLYVHDVMDKYDESELQMAEEQFEDAGISEVIEVINKTDIEKDYEISDWHYIKEDFQKERSEKLKNTNENLNELIGRSPIVCVSSLMALYGQIDENTFDDFDFRMYNDFRSRYSQLNTAQDFVEYSGIRKVEAEINKITQKGAKYLLESPVYKLLGELKSIKRRIESEKKGKELELNSLKKGREDYEAEMEAIDELIGIIYDDLDNASSISVKFTEIVNDGRNKIYFDRSSAIEQEFTDIRFQEPGPTTSGRKKQNLSVYSEILLKMDGTIRVELDSIKARLLSIAKEFISSFVHDTLYNTVVAVKDEHRKMIEIPLQDAISNRIGAINIPVETERPTSFVSGKQTQKSLYRSKFQTQYSDSRIEDDFISKYSTNLSHIPNEFVTNGRRNLNKLKNRLINELHYTPEQKEAAIKKLEEEITALDNELKSLSTDINAINKLINN